MSTNRFQSPLLAAVVALVCVFALGLVSIALEKPTGSIAGRITLEEKGFNLSTYDVRNNKVYVLAVGPQGGALVERGAWVRPDGSFRLNQLPVGEYRLKVRATGFATTEEVGVFVDEAKVTALKEPVNLAILEPSVNIASNSRVFTRQEAPHFWINAMGSDRVTVRVYRKDILTLLSQRASHKPVLEFGSDLTLYKPYSKNQHQLFADEAPLQVLTRPLTRDTEDWSRAEFKLNKPLPVGEYVLVAEVANLKGQKDWNLMWFSVSNLGLIVKQAPEKTVVRAIDLTTLKPLSGVSVRLLNKETPQSSAVGSQVSNADGFATFPLPATQRAQETYNWIAYGTQGDNHAFGGINFWNDVRDNYRTYFYTERPIYRLGQTVYFKGLTRLNTAQGYRTPKSGLPLQVVVEDPENNTLWEGQLIANDHGTFHGTYTLPKDGKTGAYQVTVNYPDGSATYHRFEVAQYRKPEYQVEVLPLDPRVIAGNQAKVRIRASYYFGAPVANARVKYSVYADTDWSSHYRLMPRPDYYGYYDDWEDDESGEGYEDSSYAGAYITEGYAQTDETGEALISFNTQPVQLPGEQPFGGDYQDKRYTVQAEVTDLSRIAVLGSGVQPVRGGDFALFVEPTAYATKAGEPVQASVHTVDYDGKPVANRSVTVSLVRWNWDRQKDEYKGKSVLETQTVTTDAKGQALLSLPTNSRYFTDGYYITAEAKDNAGHTLYEQSSVWIASEQSPYILNAQVAQQEAFSIKLDKKVYRPGDVARAVVTAPVSGKENGQLLIAVEGRQLYDVRSIPMDATAKMVEIPLKADYAPNVYVTATFVGPKHQFYNQSKVIKVSPETHFLNVSVSTDKPKYKPGDSVKYTLKATDTAGKPVENAEFSLGVVDESIYAIRPDMTADIRKFFYDRISNSVVTLSSFPEEYSGGPDKVEPRLRKDFRDMAAWLPTLKTNAKGIATATVKLPDNLTTWRATVRGIDRATNVGSAVSKVLSTQDFIVRLALPRFFTQHDQGYITAIVHNYTEQPQPVSLTVKASPQFKLQQAEQQQLTVKPDQAARYSWPVDLVSSGEGQVEVKAIGSTAGDAMALSLPVRPLGVEMAKAQSGVLTGASDTVTVPLNVPPNTSPQLANVLVSVAASSIGPVLGSFDSLIDYPYGCTEQTMSRLIPSVIAFQLHQTLGFSIDAALQKRFDDVSLKALAQLKRFHHDDGGWGWWQYDSSDAYMTAYVMEGLHRMRAVGMPLSEEQLPSHWEADGVTWLQKASKTLVQQLSDTKIASDKTQQLERLLDLAYMHYVVSLYGKDVDGATRRFLLQKTDGATPEVLAYNGLAFKALQDTKAARQSFDALNRLADTRAGMRNWDHTALLRNRLKLQASDYTYRFTGIESTALGLRAAVAMAPSDLASHPTSLDSQNLDAIERWLLLQRDQNGWANTKTTALVLRAMLEKTIAQKSSVETDFSVTSNLWDEAKRFTAANLYGPEQTTRLNLAALPGGTIRLDKQGEGRLVYQSLLTYWFPLTPGASVPQVAMPEGLTVRREFYRIQPEPVGPEGTLRFKMHAISDNRVRAGETVLMKIRINSPVALPYTIVDAALPSGGEVVSNDPRESLLDSGAEGTTDSMDWGNWWWSHQDILDDRVVMFASALPAGQSEFYALVRMELPGKFCLNPVRVEGMYSQHVRAYSSVDSVQVTE